MSKLKQAREAFNSYGSMEGLYDFIRDYHDVVDKMFAALERMQGVDLEKLTYDIEGFKRNGIPSMIGFESIFNAAQTLVDIKKEVEG